MQVERSVQCAYKVRPFNAITADLLDEKAEGRA